MTSRKVKRFVVYKNGEEFTVGTAREIAEKLKCTDAYVRKLCDKPRGPQYPITVYVGEGEWTLYKGDEFITTDTIDVIAKMMGVKEGTVKFYSSPAYLDRVKKRKPYYAAEEIM